MKVGDRSGFLLSSLSSVLLSSFSCVLAHVALKNPPSRLYDLDFLDSFRTPGLCGMNPGTELTQLEAGSQLNVTWHLGYAHRGGYRVELISETGGISTLVPAGGGEKDWENTGIFTQSHQLTLPTETCQKCTLRLLRQATEWGGSYQFRSCSDISLVETGGIYDLCGAQGNLENGVCTCNRLYSGDRCQYKSLCTTDEDCNGPKGQGRCELVSNALFQEKQCFCNKSWFGEQCEKKNKFAGEEREWDEDEFSNIQLGEHTGFWRVKDGEVEIIVEARTLTWVGVGWRPVDSTKSCQKFPSDAPAPLGTDFHAMDCTDIVIGVARGEGGSVSDFYTRDRSTPRRDTFWGGEDDLTSGAVWEDNGSTFLRFKKKVDPGLADHAFQGKLHFIWATGQLDESYLEDQLKYHGRTQRGIVIIDVPIPASSTLHPVLIGITISGVFLALLFLVQIILNIDSKCSCLGKCNPFRRTSTFSPSTN